MCWSGLVGLSVGGWYLAVGENKARWRYRVRAAVDPNRGGRITKIKRQ